MDVKWQSTHWQTLRHNYGKAPHFERYRPFLEDAYLGRQWKHLSELKTLPIKDLIGARYSKFRNMAQFLFKEGEVHPA